MILKRIHGLWGELTLKSPHSPSPVKLALRSTTALPVGKYGLVRVAGNWKLSIKGTGEFINYYIPNPETGAFLNRDKDHIIIYNRGMFDSGGKMALLSSSEALYEIIQSGDTKLEVVG